MNVTSTLVCRAHNKIYELLSVTAVDPNAAIDTIYDSRELSSILPCKLFPISNGSAGEREYVAVYPDNIQANACYVLGEFTQNGKLCDKQIMHVSPERAKWQSRINYRIHSEKCRKIRCIDEVSPAYGDKQFSPLFAISTASHIILKCSITLPVSICPQNMRIVAIGENLDLLASDFTILSSMRLPSPVAGAADLQRTSFSINIPWNQPVIHLFVFDESTKRIAATESIFKETYETLLANSDRLLYRHAGLDPYYPEWLSHHQATPYVLDLQRNTPLPGGPTFSIVVPLYETPVDLFLEMSGSVINQTYQNWELILVNASPNLNDLANEIVSLQHADGRVKVITLPENRGISENTNAGIAIAQGDYVAFLDHDDLLELNALYEYASAILSDPSIDLLYCDEDKLMPDGTPTQPFFKPDFSIDMLRNNNYICHMLTIRRSLLNQLEPNTSEFDGSQDHNLTLEAVENTTHIHHIPKILYHWRITETSTAAVASKPYAAESGLRAVKNHLKRMGIKAKVTIGARNTLQVIYDVPEPNPLVSIIIPTKNNLPILMRCIESIIEKSTYTNYEILIVDNGSSDPDVFNYYESLVDQRISIISYDRPFNFSALINEGVRNCRGDYLLFLNNDTEVITNNWIELMLGTCARNDVGAVGAKLLYPDDTIQHAGVNITGGPVHFFTHLPNGANSYFEFVETPRNLSAVTGACMMTKREAFNQVGGFDEKLAVAFNDIDYCLKLRHHNLLIVYNPLVELYHYESISRGFDEDVKNLTRGLKEKAILLSRWPEYYICDPYYTPNTRAGLPDSAYYAF